MELTNADPRSGHFRVTFEVDVIVNGGHHGEAIVNAYQRLKRLIEGAEKAGRAARLFDTKSDNLRGDAARFNQAEVQEIWKGWGPESFDAKPGDSVRMWLEDATVRGTLYDDPIEGLSVALVGPGVDPLNTLERYISYPVHFMGRDRRMELLERQQGPNDGE